MGEMADLMLFSHYDIDNFDEDTRIRRRNQYYESRGRHYQSKYDPLKYSRRAAVCEKCGEQYEKLYTSIKETTENARKDGWQIELVGCHYEWYCPKCKAAHDFENIEPSAYGEWVYGEYDVPHCSECGAEVKEISPFCPQCGARMEEDDND